MNLFTGILVLKTSEKLRAQSVAPILEELVKEPDNGDEGYEVDVTPAGSGSGERLRIHFRFFSESKETLALEFRNAFDESVVSSLISQKNSF